METGFDIVRQLRASPFAGSLARAGEDLDFAVFRIEFAEPKRLDRDFRERLQRAVDNIGELSARAQGLRQAVTTLGLVEANKTQTIYLAVAGTVVLGFIKLGPKHLFLRDHASDLHEVDILAVLDFYVHESFQRRGIGRALFEAALDGEGIAEADKIAYDRPSDKFLRFLAVHFGLTDFVPQENKFVVFDSFFGPAPARREAAPPAPAPTAADRLRDLAPSVVPRGPDPTFRPGRGALSSRGRSAAPFATDDSTSPFAAPASSAAPTRTAASSSSSSSSSGSAYESSYAASCRTATTPATPMDSVRMRAAGMRRPDSGYAEGAAPFALEGDKPLPSASGPSRGHGRPVASAASSLSIGPLDGSDVAGMRTGRRVVGSTTSSSWWGDMTTEGGADAGSAPRPSRRIVPIEATRASGGETAEASHGRIFGDSLPDHLPSGKRIPVGGPAKPDHNASDIFGTRDTGRRGDSRGDAAGVGIGFGGGRARGSNAGMGGAGAGAGARAGAGAGSPSRVSSASLFPWDDPAVATTSAPVRRR